MKEHSEKEQTHTLDMLLREGGREEGRQAGREREKTWFGALLDMRCENGRRAVQDV
jgi:hypothetical protein